MAVIVKYDTEGNPIFRSVGTIGTSDAEREKAYNLDKLLQTELKRVSKPATKSKTVHKTGGKNKVKAYWEFGSVLRKIFFEPGLVKPAEKPLYWLNVKLHAPKEFLAKDRGPNRIHVAYCFRLAGYPKNIALKREWSEWVYLFDSPSINKEIRFDRWNETKIGDEPKYLNRKHTRIFVQCLNSMLKDIETRDLTDEELIRCYEGAWSLSINILQKLKEINTKKFKLIMREKITEKRNHISELMDDLQTPKKYADVMTDEIVSSIE